MGYLLGCLKKEKERTAAFQALGLLVVAVRAEIQPYLSKVLEIIKAALPPKDFAHKYVLKNKESPQMILIQSLKHVICHVICSFYFSHAWFLLPHMSKAVSTDVKGSIS